jgi:hypothetical protein
MKLIWNPWKRIKELEQDVANLSESLDSAYEDVEGMLSTLEHISLVAGPRSSAIVRRMSKMAEDAVDKFYGFELGEE